MASAVARFGPDAAAELASYTNNVVVFGGAKDPQFLRDMSDLCGQVERIRKTRTSGDSGSESVASQAVLESVLRPDEIKALGEGFALVLADNLPPVISRMEGMWTWDTWPEIQQHVADFRQANEVERAKQSTERKNRARSHARAWADLRRAGTAA